MDDFRLFEQTVREQRSRFWGKYRGFVADNQDPQNLGRLRLTVPSVLGETVSDWALPCFAYGGAANLGVIAVPPVDAQVVVEFLEGDPSSAMWTGSFWRNASEVPAEYDGPHAKVMKTDSGHVLVFRDSDGEESVSLTSAAGAVLEMNPGGSFQLSDSQGATVKLDAEAGEVHVEDANGNSVTLTASGITLADASGNEIVTEGGGVTVKGTTVTVEGQSVSLGGAGGEALIKAQTFLALFNAHTHVCTAPGSPSGPPLPPLTPAVLTMKTTAS